MVARFTLNLVAIGVIGFWMFVDTTGRPTWALVVGGTSLLLWLIRAVIVAAFDESSPQVARLAFGLNLGAALTGAAAAGGTSGLSINVAAVAVMAMIGASEIPLTAGVVGALLTVAVTAVALVLDPMPTSAELALLTALALGALAGLSRRQFREAQARRLLLEQQDVALRAEAARIGLARDLHDVLAHSLGGLVVQLDAVGALLDAGDVPAAARRVQAARGLAADGLRDARAAVAALRDPDRFAGSVPAIEIGAAIEQFAASARSIGGTIDVRVDISRTAPDLPDRAAEGLRRTVQEGLSNARTHADGQPVHIELRVDDRAASLLISNPLGTGAIAAGDDHRGYGLQGMAERFRAIGSAATIEAGPRDRQFVVRARIDLGEPYNVADGSLEAGRGPR